MNIQRIDANNLHIHIAGFVNFGGFYIRQMGPADKGIVYKGHSHQIDHCMHLVSGKVSVKSRNPETSEEGIVEVLVPRAKLSIKRDWWHEITALEDHTEWECWFAKAEADGMDMDWTV